MGGDRPRSSSLKGALALSTGISPYLLQMLTRAPFATRSWNYDMAVMRAFPTNHGCRCSTNLVNVVHIEGSRVSRSSSDFLPTHPRAQGLSTHLCHLILAPETGIVQGHIPMLIHRIDVSFVLKQLVPVAKQKEVEGTVSPK